MKLATDAPVTEAHPESIQPPVPRRVWWVAGGAGVLFIALQLALAAYAADMANEAGLYGARAVAESRGHRMFVALTDSVISYVGFGVFGVILALRGHRAFAGLPPVLYVLLSILTSSSHRPRYIGDAWNVPCFAQCPGPWFSNVWAGSLIDLVLVLLPIVIAARSGPRPSHAHKRDPLAMACVLTTLIVVMLVVRSLSAVDTPPDVATMATVIAFGFAAGPIRGAWLFGHAMVSVAAAGDAGPWLLATLIAPTSGFTADDGVRYFMSSFGPVFGLAISASLWHPLRLLAERGYQSPKFVVGILNLLNVADALLTHFAVRSGNALEANPIIRYTGLPLKIVIVAVASAFIYRVRPQALLWPTLALLVVFSYHLTGFVINR